MSRKIRFLAFSLLAVALVARLIQSADYSVNISYVNVWVKATDSKGHPITDLTANDLTLKEDGKLVNSECFEQIKYDIGKEQEDPFAEFRSDSQTASHENSEKKFVVFLDLLNTTQGELRFMEPKLQDFLMHAIDSSNDVMLAALLPNRKLGVLVPFTRNHQQVADLLDKAPGNQTRDARLVSNESDLMQEIREWEQGIHTFGNALDEYRALYSKIHILAKEEKEQGLFTLRSLRSFGDYLSASDLGDHTVIVYVSGGFTTDPGREYYSIVDSAMAGYMSDPKSEEADQIIQNEEQDNDVLNEIKNTAWYLNRLNVTLYSIDSRGMITPGQDVSQADSMRLSGGRDYFSMHSHQEALNSLASETGGVAFVGSQNYQDCLSRMVQDLNHQYLLCYRAPEHDKRGEFHKIQVVSKRSGVNLRYRKGYIG